ncbi:MAG: hypothetical protein QGG74_03900 [Phycisphaerales bacterium]|jgi:hypothetical protein|nr:hypothetical protein [Phycisphaerales bacterium]MDP6987169.1 hypothetical protein [Phycisphaerales bacterium]
MFRKAMMSGVTCAVTAAASAGPNDVWLNEIHYDNAGGDTGELLEIAVGSNITPSDITISKYNGSNGTVYGSLNPIADMDLGESEGDMTLYWAFLPANGLQNGGPDGVAIDIAGVVVQFLSYEGTMTATDGPAMGMTSEDIGVSESSSTPVGASLGLIGTGADYEAFTWAVFKVNSAGQINVGQEVLPDGGGGPVTHVVQQVGFSFDPPIVDAHIGDTIRFEWTGGNHSVVDGDPYNCVPEGMYFYESLNSGNPVVEFVIPPDAPQDIDYLCDVAVHCSTYGMTGSIHVIDGAATDTDGDGWPDDNDNCVDVYNPGQEDCDGDGEGDVCDPDAIDCNANGVPDACEIADGDAADCNENGVPDSCDLADGTLHDDNGNGFPDECEVAVPAIQLQEIRTDQPGADNDEYFEIHGYGGPSLDSVWYVVIGDGTGGSGVVECAIDLSNMVFPVDSPTLLVAEDDDTLGVQADYVLPGALNFENNDNVTHVLLVNFLGAVGDDLDTDDDGILDFTPWQDTIDGVRIIADPAGGDWTYLMDEEVGPTADGYAPSHVYRYTSACGNFAMGTYDPWDPESADTPGGENPACPSDCPADLDGDGQVAVGDLLILIGGYGGNDPTHDLDGNGTVGIGDILMLIGVWGPC